MIWDFWNHTPESLHQVTILFSNRGTPVGYRHMNGYSSHTFVWVNAKGERFFVKKHFKTCQGSKNFTGAEAAEVAKNDPDSATRDLFGAIKKGDFPQWDMFVQVMPEKEADNYRFDVFDITKIWPHSDYPLIPVGKLTLNRNPENYFAEVEQAAFSPANVVPGIGHSPDKMLQMRILSYGDAQRYRVGANHQALPVNAARCPVHNYQRDGAMRFDGNHGGDVNYQPNSFGGPVEDPSVKEPPLAIDGTADRYDHRAGNDDFTQAGDLFRLMDAGERGRLLDTIAGAMQGVPEDIVRRQIGYFTKADPAYGNGIARRLAIALAAA